MHLLRGAVRYFPLLRPRGPAQQGGWGHSLSLSLSL